MSEKEMVNHPDHYQSKQGIEVIDVIRSFTLDFWLGNCIKYILRAGRKGPLLRDLKKAQWYLNDKIRELEEQQTEKTDS